VRNLFYYAEVFKTFVVF